MNELSGAEVFFRSRLIGDSAILAKQGKRVYMDIAPQKDENDPAGGPPICPRTVIHQMSGHDVVGLGGRRVLTRPTYLVRTITDGAPSSIVDLVDLIDAALTITDPITATYGAKRVVVIGCVRLSPKSDTGYENGVRYHWKGGIYELQLQEGS